MQGVKQRLNGVFDDRLETREWENRVDWAVIGLIVMSTVEVFLSTFDSISLRYGGWLKAIDFFSTAVFTVEVTLRIWCADLLEAKYKGFWGRVRYCLSFYGLIDIVSTYSFYVALLFPVPYSALKVLRVFRLLRVFRYMKSFRLLGDAFGSKRHERQGRLRILNFEFRISSWQQVLRPRRQPHSPRNLQSYGGNGGGGLLERSHCAQGQG